MPRPKQDGKLTVAEVCNEYLTAKLHKLETGELSPRSFADYQSTTDRLVEAFGKTRIVEDKRDIQRLDRFLQLDQYRAAIGQLSDQLLEHGTLNCMQVIDIYEEATDCEERTTEPGNPWKPLRRWE